MSNGSRFKLIELPGRSKYRIPVTSSYDASEDEGRISKTPDWIVRLDNITNSSIADYTDFTELFGWYGESSRFTASDISSDFVTSATLKHSELILLIPNGGFAAPIESRMYEGIPIDELVIVRLGNIRQTRVETQALVYRCCYIQRFQQQLDRVFLQVTVKTKENTLYVFDVDGMPRGQVVSRVDFSSNQIDYQQEVYYNKNHRGQQSISGGYDGNPYDPYNDVSYGNEPYYGNDRYS